MPEAQTSHSPAFDPFLLFLFCDLFMSHQFQSPRADFSSTDEQAEILGIVLGLLACEVKATKVWVFRVERFRERLQRE
jgi:hypothetical protein